MPILNMIGPAKSKGTEYIEYRAVADSNGTLYIPTAGRTTTGVFGAAYNWKVSVDGIYKSTYSGTSSNGGSISLSGYIPNSSHIINITPVSEGYGWARAFACDGTSSAATYIIEIIYDGSYKGYAVSATDAGGYFRYEQYRGCSRLQNCPEEYLPDTVTTIGKSFRENQYYGCTILQHGADEYIPNSVTSIGTYFRASQYSRAGLIEAPAEMLPTSATIGDYFRRAQYQGIPTLAYANIIADNNVGTTQKRQYQYSQLSSATNPILLQLYIRGSVVEGSLASNSMGIADKNVAKVYVPSSLLTAYRNSSDWSNITDSKFVGY